MASPPKSLCPMARRSSPTRPTTTRKRKRASSSAMASPDPTPSPNLIVLEGVSKDYVSGAGVVRALRELDLTIKHGDFVAIVGASGSGKSTLMNILGCLDRPTRGKYILGDVEVGSREN